MNEGVAIVGMACRYPDAKSPIELWENALAQRRAFRRIPAERLRVEDYFAEAMEALDSIYTTEACLIHDYDFDRVKYRVATSTYRGADLAHWLALDVAAESLNDAGFPDGYGLPNESTGVMLGNTLTGEFSRANTLRLRWPYVRRVMDSVFYELGWPDEKRAKTLRDCERVFKQPFAPMSEETLAGNLSNTIAGRICNHFDLKGAGYTLDAACASSLLAVSAACSALSAGDLDVALAGGVDLSLDPFELVGFSRAGALARGPMLVYDERSSGFLPGEGCGFVVLMRYADAVSQGRRAYAVIRGWGVSSDGAGGITRPEPEGQLLAIKRAYRRAGFGIETVPYFEGHGTGTAVGDATEIKTLSMARGLAGMKVPAAAISSVKGNIGHTKAAGGVAGLIKAAMALQAQIIPAVTSCELPRAELRENGAALRALGVGELWPPEQPLRAGVSAMGFGGINTHVVIEGTTSTRRIQLSGRESALLSSSQDSEIFLLSSDDREGLIQIVSRLLGFAWRLSYAELGDLAARLSRDSADNRRSCAMRAAIVAATPKDLDSKLRALLSRLKEGAAREIDRDAGIFTGSGPRGRLGFLFPGQASPVYVTGGALARRFPVVREIHSTVELASTKEPWATELAQPAIITAGVAALKVLEHCGVEAELAIGHSVGEIAALHWAGAFGAEAAVRIASIRGRIMGELKYAQGAMASIRAPLHDVERMLRGSSLVLACINSPQQSVVSGEAEAVAAFADLARQKGIPTAMLRVSHAFHSPLVAPAASAIERALAGEEFQPLVKRVFSTVTGAELAADQDLQALLSDQVTSPVLFLNALCEAAPSVDLFIEAGPGSVLAGLVRDSLDVPVVAIDAGGDSLEGFLKAIAASYALGVAIDTAPLFNNRFNRPFDLNWNPRFFANPCEQAPVLQGSETTIRSKILVEDQQGEDSGAARAADAERRVYTQDGLLELLRRLVADRTELPVQAIQDRHRLLGDLHLNSIAVSQIVSEAARRAGLSPPVAPTDYSTVSIADVAAALEELRLTGGSRATGKRPPVGVDSWVRCFNVDLVERSLPERDRLHRDRGHWQIMAPGDSSVSSDLGAMLSELGGRGVAVLLETEDESTGIDLLLDGAHAALVDKKCTDFLLVQHRDFGGAFIRSLHLEAPWINTCVVKIPRGHPNALASIAAEVGAVRGYSEAHYDASGTRRIPSFSLSREVPALKAPPLGPSDLVLVSGGGKGIAAECTLALARKTGARLAIAGRSSPLDDPELATNLERLSFAGIDFRYYAVDVTDREAVLRATSKIQSEMGDITGLIHGAGANKPGLIESLDAGKVRATMAPKVAGAHNLLAGINPERLKLFVTFGSLIARTGMRGESDYALANEALRQLTEDWQSSHPRCRSLCIEWSVWAGAGMGQRLGSLDALIDQGISPITLDQGIEIFCRLVCEESGPVSVVVSGRFGEPPAIGIERPEVPLRRFLEQTASYYPRVELIVQVELSSDTDPYFEDHVFRGDRLFPAVLGLEAMAQVAMALAETHSWPCFEDMEFNRPIVVLPGRKTKILISALLRGEQVIEVVIRSEETDYQVNHFRTLCNFLVQASEGQPAARVNGRFSPQQLDCFIPVDPRKDLYGGLLFHRGRFIAVNGYYDLSATGCVAEIRENEGPWFGPYLPQELVLGNPGRRDATIHAIQGCVPDATLLPVGARRLRIYRTDGHGVSRVLAHERSHDGDGFVYDVDVVGEDGTLLEFWEGLRLQRVSANPLPNPCPAALLVPYIQRAVSGVPGVAPVSIAIQTVSGGDRHLRSNDAMRAALGENRVLVRRPDGKPESVAGAAVSASHCGLTTMAVAGYGPLACDMEVVTERRLVSWRDLLGEEGMRLANQLSLMASNNLNNLHVAATRVWTALECLRKCGSPVDAPLLISGSAGECVVLSSGNLSIVTVLAILQQGMAPAIFSVLSSANSNGQHYGSALQYEALGA